MINLQEIRLKNLADLVDKLFNGNWSQFSIAIQKSQPSVAVVKNRTRVFTEKFARHIETKLNLPIGSLDLLDSQPIGAIGIYPIRVYTTKMSKDLSFCEFTDRYIHLSEGEILKMGSGCMVNTLKAFQVYGDSMENTVLDGAIAIVDTLQKEIIQDKIYAIVCGDMERAEIRRLRKVSDGILIKSDNSAWSDDKVPYESERLIILGRVLSVINPL